MRSSQAYHTQKDMNLSQVKDALRQMDQVTFLLPSGRPVPEHFHVTEIGTVTRNFIDCGGTLRSETAISFQLWTAHDYEHRLSSEKLIDIISLAESVLSLPEAEVEVAYQEQTIGTYGLAFDGSGFVLTTKYTDCLAKDKCGIPTEKQPLALSELKGQSGSGCQPGSGCC